MRTSSSLRPPPPRKYPQTIIAHRLDTNGRHNSRSSSRRRIGRIFAFALCFVLTALRQMMYRGEHSDFQFFASLLLDGSSTSGGVGLSPYYSASSLPKNYEVYKSAIGEQGTEDAALVIFYNLYIPHDKVGIDNAIDVIKDQMGQIASALLRIEKEGSNNSNINHKKQEKKRGIVFYNLIGNEDAFSTQQMNNVCHELHPRLECRLLQYYPEAGEDVTLQDVYDFCHSDLAKLSSGDDATLNHKNNTQTSTHRRIVYLHSKGSYHSQPENHIWRRQMTEAALHPHCLNPPNETCDVCGAQFYIKYAIMFPGNMFTTSCSYIQKLIAPSTNGEYAKRKRDSIKRFLMLRLWGVMQATLDKDNVEHYGLDRYQWEHWIASHPSIRPCEVHTTEVGPMILLGKDREGRKFGPEYYDWGMAPRRISDNLGGLRQPRLRLEANPDLQFREYYYLPGNLLKWFYLYGSDGVPAQDSWVWDVYPAGERWKKMVGQHGEKAIDVMVDNSNPRFYSAFASNHSNMVGSPSQTFEEEDLSNSNPPIVVFYQISFPPGDKENALSTIKAQFDALAMGQYDNVTNLFDKTQKVLLYYTISGGNSDDIVHVSNLCKEKSDRITCRQLGKYDSERVQGEILHHLHAFCNAKPSFDVIHMTNQLSGNDISKIQEVTSGIMSKMCRPTESSCNVCGTEFYPLPFLHFVDNIFSASCGYVKQLLPPAIFEERMNDIAGDALVAQIEEIYTTKLIGFNARILGSYQHSIEHWIGSHPDLEPCDISPMTGADGKHGKALIDRLKNYAQSPAPRRGSAPAGHINEDGESRFRNRREVALREYYYLAGNVFRWHSLYNGVPSSDSWAWRWFPDGKIWEAAARSGGAYAVNHIADQLEGGGSAVD